MSAELDPLEQHLVDALRALAPPERAVEIPAEAAQRVARAGREPRDRPRRAVAAGAEARLLHDRLRRARVERARRARAAARPIPRSSTTAPGASTSRAPARQGATGRGTCCSGMAAAVEEPIAGGRHKVFGHHDLAVIPQTSTIASHLPRAVGIAFAIERARELGVASAWPAGRGRRLLVRRRVAEPRDGAVRAQRGGPLRVPGRAAAAPLRLRGQRARDQRADAGGLGRAVAPREARARRRAGRRGRSGRRARHCDGARRVGA